MDTEACRGSCWGPSYQTDGRTSAVQRRMDRVALLLLLNMYSDSAFLFLCLHGPVPPCQFSLSDCERLLQIEASLYICALPLQSGWIEVRVPLLWTNPALSYPTVFILKSYHKNIMQICMIQRQEMCQYLWILVLPTEVLRGKRMELTSELCVCSVLSTQNDKHKGS